MSSYYCLTISSLGKKTIVCMSLAPKHCKTKLRLLKSSFELIIIQGLPIPNMFSQYNNDFSLPVYQFKSLMYLYNTLCFPLSCAYYM